MLRPFGCHYPLAFNKKVKARGEERVLYGKLRDGLKRQRWPSELRLQGCHCCGSGSILAQELLHVAVMAQKKKKRERRGKGIILIKSQTGSSVCLRGWGMLQGSWLASLQGDQAWTPKVTHTFSSGLVSPERGAQVLLLGEGEAEGMCWRQQQKRT